VHQAVGAGHSTGLQVGVQGVDSIVPGTQVQGYTTAWTGRRTDAVCRAQ
jgi:hypothetical protein